MKWRKRVKTNGIEIPPFDKIIEGYQVLITSNTAYMKNKKGEKSWLPYVNTWGTYYSIKGFAVNRAKALLRWNPQDTLSCVIEQSTGEIVWKSWENNSQQH